MTKGYEKRSKNFFRTGNALVIAVGTIFFGVFVFTFARTNFWQQYVFSNLDSLANSCQYRVVDADGRVTPYESIQIPHFGVDLLAGKANRQNYRIEYACSITPDSEYMATAHLGWAVGKTISVRIDDNQPYTLQGPKKLVFPVQGETNILISIEPQSKSSLLPGLSANQPAVMTYTNQENNLVGGIEVLLGLGRGLNQALPIFSLLIVICIAWVTGFKSRISLIAKFAMLWVVVDRSLAIVSSLRPDMNQIIVHKLTYVLSCCFSLAMILFFMESLRIIPKKIYPLARLLTAVGVIGIIATLSGWGMPDTVLLGIKITSALIITAILGRVLTRQTPKFKWDNPYVALAFLTVVSFILDTFMKGGSFRALSEIFIPFVTSITIVYDFSTAERRFLAERNTTIKLSQQVALAKATTDILARFLPDSLVQQLSNNSEQNVKNSLMSMLSPTERRIAVIQADIRGFTKFLDQSDATQTSDMLRKVFEPVVDAAQQYSMIKLVGDCLFAFVEERDGENPVVKTLDIANALISSIHKLYQEDAQYRTLRFGIGINYGKGIVGNLSSTSCIDYTVIGKPVNLVARLEEATKTNEVSSMIGDNGIVLGPDAVKMLPDRILNQIGVVENVIVRSFPDITWIGYLTAEQCLELEHAVSMAPRKLRPSPSSLHDVA